MRVPGKGVLEKGDGCGLIVFEMGAREYSDYTLFVLDVASGLLGLDSEGEMLQAFREVRERIGVAEGDEAIFGACEKAVELMEQIAVALVERVELFNLASDTLRRDLVTEYVGCWGVSLDQIFSVG